MPYINTKYRADYDDEIERILGVFRAHYKLDPMSVAGHFTYVVYRLLKFFSNKFWMRALGIGCLICAILEIYRQDHADYEDEKIQQNGDVQ